MGLLGLKDPIIRAEEAEVDRIVRLWSRACEGVGLERRVDTVSGPTIITPPIRHVILGPPTVLSVQLLPGLLPQDVRDAAYRLAPHLGCHGLRVEPRGHGEWAVITLLTEDPLAEVDEFQDGPMTGPVAIGRDEDGLDILAEVDDLGHMICQGQTRSGKSTALYGLLAQVAQRKRAGYPIRVAGVDASGLLLRPWMDTPDGKWCVAGLSDLHKVEMTLGLLVDEMDDRIRRIPDDADRLPVTGDDPLTIVVLEEWPGVLRALDGADPKSAKRVRLLVSRLLAEGHKAGYRVWMIAQRAEAAIVGAAERAQASYRISFRVDNAATVELLHPEVDEATAVVHTTAAPGIGLLSAPGRPLTRFRGP